MRNAETPQIALVNIERHPLMLIAVALFSGLIIYGASLLLKDVNPIGFLVMVLGGFLAFYCLWLFLNPFAQIFDDKFEIKYSFLSQKARYYVDIKKVSPAKGYSIYITYNDDEIERIRLFGIAHSHISLFKDQLDKMVSKSLSSRT